ncbi:ribonuclease H-like domain-containing protein [Tanacetum coccineum]
MPIHPLPSTHKPTTPSLTPNNHITTPVATTHGNAPTTNTHHMVTRAKTRISKPLACMNCHATTTSPIPCSHLHALLDLNWHKAMVDEYNDLISNGTWALVPCLANVNIVRSMWIFKHKFNADGSLSRGSDVAYLLLYVDDIVLTASSTTLLQCIITLFHSEFAMTDLDSLNYFLGISAQRSKSGLFLSQSKFAEEILERAHMQHCNPCKTPVDTESKLGSDGDHQICLYMPDPRDLHFTDLKRILHYTVWLQNLLLELHAPLSTATLVYCDNVSAVYLSTNHVQHQGTKHIEIDIHFIREYVASGQVRVLHVPSRFQYEDIFTKGLPTALFFEFRSSLNV